MEPKKMAPEEIAEIRERESKATPGPWVFEARTGDVSEWLVSEADNPDDDGDRPSLLFNGDTPHESDNWEFIAAARNYIPRLLAHIDAQAAENNQLRAERDRFALDRAEVCKALGERAHPGMSPAENVASVVGQNATFRELASEAAITLPDLEDEEFRAECMARLGKDSKALIEDTATLIQRLAAHHKEPKS